MKMLGSNDYNILHILLTTEDCVVCSTARPRLTTTSIPYVDEQNLACILRLFTKKTFDVSDECYKLHLKLPPVMSKDVPVSWILGTVKYTCFIRDNHSNRFTKQ